MAKAGVFVIQPASASPDFVAVEARCAVVQSASSRRSISSWSLVWDVSSDSSYSYATLEFDNRNRADGIDADRATLRAGRVTAGADSVAATVAITSGISFDGRHNSLLMEWSAGETRIYGGNRGLSLLLRFPSLPPSGGECGIMSGSAVAPLDIVTEARHRADTRLHTSLTPADIDSLIAASDDPVAGYWEYLDRDNDPDRARPGGRYTLAIIPSGTAGRYDIIYASGARVNAGQWQCGMIKGHLTSTAFVDHYTLEWFDAMCQPVVSELHADLTRPAILALNFPLMRTTMRFARRKMGR